MLRAEVTCAAVSEQCSADPAAPTTERIAVEDLQDANLIPRIDLTWPVEEIVSAVTKAADSGGPGFFYLVNHGVPQAVFDDAIREAHAFYSRPQSVKQAISALDYHERVAGGQSWAPPLGRKGGSGALDAGRVSKGYVLPGSEGGYEKDAETDVRREGATANLNMRESLVFRYPEYEATASAMGDNRSPLPLHLHDYEAFLRELSEKSEVEMAHPANRMRRSIGGGENATCHSQRDVLSAARKFHLPNQWPAGQPEFRPRVGAYFAAMEGVASRMWGYLDRVLARVNGANATASSRVPSDPGMYTFNLVRYPTQRRELSGHTEFAVSEFGIADHTDWEAFTLLYPCFYNASAHDTAPHVDAHGYTFTGLEVYFRGRWVAVPHIPGSIIVNQGEMLSRLSNGRLKPPVHRVHTTISAPSALDRYSLISFWAPNYEYLIPDQQAPAGKVLAGEYYLKRNNLL